MMLLLFVVKSIQAETEVPTLYNLHSVFKMNLTVKERSRTPKNCFIIACPCGGWIPLFGILIQGVEQFLKKIFVRRRRTMKWHQINTKTRRNSRPHSADKKNKEKTSIKIGPRTVSFMKSTLCLPRCSWLSDTSIELYCVT